MSKLNFHIILISCLVYSGAFADTGGAIHVDEKSPFVSYESSEYYLTVPRADIAGTDYWGKWKLNMSNYNWELIDYGTSATGTRTASGEYIYNAQKGILIYKFEHSTFYACGPELDPKSVPGN